MTDETREIPASLAVNCLGVVMFLVNDRLQKLLHNREAVRSGKAFVAVEVMGEIYRDAQYAMSGKKELGYPKVQTYPIAIPKDAQRASETPSAGAEDAVTGIPDTTPENGEETQ